jgi:hypothetical protein
MSDRDYYEILGLTPRADGAMVDQAYWHLARKYQQMAATDARAQYMLDELNEAYGVLGTPRLREQYDAFRDDVLLRSGMIRPVAAKQQPRPQPAVDRGRPSDEPRAARMPSLAFGHWRTYATAAAIVLLGLAGAWSGVNPLLVLLAMAGGLAITLAPVLRRRVADVTITLPALDVHAPRVAMPRLPEVNLPKLGDVAVAIVPEHDDPIDADDLRMSTAAMISRWRSSVGLRTLQPEPSSDLVDIVESERELAADESPVNAALEILRRNSPKIPTV